jgi:hypothetical protein
MNRKSNQLLMGSISVVVALIKLFSLTPFWIWQWVSLILIGLVIDLLIIQYISDRNRNRLNKIKPILLPHLASIDYTDNNDKCNFCIGEKYPEYSDVDSCLRKDVESLNKDIKIYNRQAEAFVNKLNLKIIEFVKQEIPDNWDFTIPQPEPIRNYTKRNYVRIGYKVRFCNENRYRKPESRLGLFYQKEGMNRWILYLGNMNNRLAVSDNEDEIKDIQKIITKLFDDTIDNDNEFKRLNEFFEQIKREHELYKEQIELKIINVENWILLKD